jgi:3-deoxy-D-manno-octulosonic-acid transferase
MISLGADRDNVINTGSFKFDVNVTVEEAGWARSLNGPVIIAGSTHRGEESLALEAYKGLIKKHEELVLIIAPRHPQRFDEVWDALRLEFPGSLRRSGLEDAEHISGAVVLLDTVGELSSVYRAADVAVIGGSFIPHGGQNPLEPAYWGKPVICGPHMDNFPFIKEFYDAGAALECSSETLEACIDSLLESSERRMEIGGRARDILVRNRGAVQKTIEVVEGLTGKG